MTLHYKSRGNSDRDVVIHVQGNAMMGVPGAQVQILGCHRLCTCPREKHNGRIWRVVMTSWSGGASGMGL
jgi:hypothetical protein